MRPSFLLGRKNKQLEAVFDWLSAVANKNDLILLEQSGNQKIYHFEFPLKFGDKPKRTKEFKEADITFFVKFSSRKMAPSEEEWHLIFKSPELEIYEKKKRGGEKNINSLRRGLNSEEKKAVLRLARESLEFFFKEGKPFKMENFKLFYNLFNLKIDLSVAFWTDGVLRGLCILENKILSDGIIEASILAARNAGFKPLALDELPYTRIEINLISNLKIPLNENAIGKNETFYDKGYLLKRGKNKGWFLPSFFNTKPLKNLKDLIFELSGGEGVKKDMEIFIFETDNFIEGRKQGVILNLDGAVAQAEPQIENIERMACLAADWLLKVQESDGNFIPIINPLSGIIARTSQVDWSRSALSGWSLIELGKITGKNNYIEAGKKNFLFLKKYLLQEQMVMPSFDYAIMSLTFLGEMALSLDCWQEALQCGFRILEQEALLKFDPIVFSQAGGFLTSLCKNDKKFLELAIKLADIIQKEFENNLKNKAPMGLSSWAGMVDLFLRIFEAIGDFSYWQTAKKTADWLLENQLNNGSFKSATNSDFVFTRGTGKIGEVLAKTLLLKDKRIDKMSDLLYYKEGVKKAFGWLEKMQYSLESSYFVPHKNLEFIIGGFRHDYFNNDLWIDSAGHFLLGAGRFLKPGF